MSIADKFREFVKKEDEGTKLAEQYIHPKEYKRKQLLQSAITKMKKKKSKLSSGIKKFGRGRLRIKKIRLIPKKRLIIKLKEI